MHPRNRVLSRQHTARSGGLQYTDGHGDGGGGRPPLPPGKQPQGDGGRRSRVVPNRTTVPVYTRVYTPPPITVYVDPNDRGECPPERMTRRRPPMRSCVPSRKRVMTTDPAWVVVDCCCCCSRSRERAITVITLSPRRDSSPWVASGRCRGTEPHFKTKIGPCGQGRNSMLVGGTG